MKRKKKIKKKCTFPEKYKNLVNKINKKSPSLWLPTNDYYEYDKNNDSWFNIKEYSKKNHIPHKIIDTKIPISKKEKIIRCQKIKMFVSPKQHKILQAWMDAYIAMYNYTLRAIKINRSKYVFYEKKYKNYVAQYVKFIRENNKINKQIEKININSIVNDNKIKDKKKCIIFGEYIELLEKKIKNEIIIDKLEIYLLNKYVRLDVLNFPLNFRDFRNLETTKTKKKQFKKYYSNANLHILDQAINSVYSMYKSCITNYKNGNIKHFRMRYLRYNNNSKIIKIEKCLVSKSPINNTFCIRSFTDDFKLENNFKLNKVGGDFIIHYNKTFNKYILLNPVKENIIRPHKKKETLGIDLGLRTFATGFSNNKWLQIGDGNLYKLEKYLNNIDAINASLLNGTKKKKALNTQYKHITNYVDELHWKSINYLIKNYGNIIIGSDKI